MGGKCPSTLEAAVEIALSLCNSVRPEESPEPAPVVVEHELPPEEVWYRADHVESPEEASRVPNVGASRPDPREQSGEAVDGPREILLMLGFKEAEVTPALARCSSAEA